MSTSVHEQIKQLVHVPPKRLMFATIKFKGNQKTTKKNGDSQDKTTFNENQISIRVLENPIVGNQTRESTIQRQVCYL